MILERVLGPGVRVVAALDANRQPRDLLVRSLVGGGIFELGVADRVTFAPNVQIDGVTRVAGVLVDITTAKAEEGFKADKQAGWGFLWRV